MAQKLRQPVGPWAWRSIGTNGYFDLYPCGRYTFQPVESNVLWFVSSATFKLKGCLMQLSAAPGVGFSRTFTLYKNGSPTSLVLAFGATDTVMENTTTVINASPGDYFYWKEISTGTPVASSLRWRMWALSDTDVEWMSSTFADLGTQNTYMKIWRDDSETNPFSYVMLFPTVLKRVNFRVKTTPPAGTSYTLTICKNEATTGETLTISNGETAKEWNGSVSLNAGDRLYLYHTWTGSPGSQVGFCGLSFKNTADKFASVYARVSSIALQSSDGYLEMSGTITNGSTTESAVQSQLACPLKLRGLGAGLSKNTGIGAGQYYNFFLRNTTPADRFELKMEHVGAYPGSPFYGYNINHADDFDTSGDWSLHAARYAVVGSPVQCSEHLTFWLESSYESGGGFRPSIVRVPNTQLIRCG